MNKIINFNQAAQINALFKAQNIEYTLHLHGGCQYCVPQLECDGKEHDVDVLYAIMNDYLKAFFIQVKPDALNPLNVIVY